MTGDASVLGSLHSVDGEGVVRMEDRLDTGIDDLWGALTDPDRLDRVLVGPERGYAEPVSHVVLLVVGCRRSLAKTTKAAPERVGHGLR